MKKNTSLETRKNGAKGVKAADDASITIISIDYPQEGEKVNTGSYAVRISGAAHPVVEFSADGVTWQSCRPSIGYHWCDWNPSKAGSYTLAVRAGQQNSLTVSTTRRCRVIGNQ